MITAESEHIAPSVAVQKASPFKHMLLGANIIVDDPIYISTDNESALFHVERRVWHNGAQVH